MAVTTEVVEKIGTENVTRTRTEESGTEVTAEIDSRTVEVGESSYLTFTPNYFHLFDGTLNDAERLN